MQTHEACLSLTKALQAAGLNVSLKFIEAVIAPQLGGVQPEDIERANWQKGLKFAYTNGVWSTDSVDIEKYENLHYVGLGVVGQITYDKAVDELGTRLGKQYTKLGERVLVKLKGESEPRYYFFVLLYATMRH